MPSVKSIGYTSYASRPMEKTTSMNKQVSDHGNNLTRTARIGGRTRAGANFNLMNFPERVPPGARNREPSIRRAVANQPG